MRDHAQKEEEDAEINMTPMLDIVFIMLIFFIVTAVFVKESGITVEKPTLTMAEMQRNASILIAIESDGSIWLNREETEIDSVRTTVEKLHSENPRGSVVIQADLESPAGVMMKVYDAIRDAGVPKIAIASEQN
ncbi:ExbD/TolR family protein [Yunchengibacter salinarum]|uniref:ExbD/TolR family protein n=1 Tax=Yunchengibacter salinarum TaxID=3133399 RepID=UPI0035B5AB7D